MGTDFTGFTDFSDLADLGAIVTDRDCCLVKTGTIEDFK